MDFFSDHPVPCKYAIILRGFFTPAVHDIPENFQINKNIKGFTMFWYYLFLK